jgi:murein DD-endopeptidase MepM/ murein hydrolase activator NlpD
MRRRFLTGMLLITAFARATAARANAACRTLLMPVVQLKQVSRGFGPTPAHGFHSGLDLCGPYGSPVRTAADGVVTFIGTYFGYGLMIDVRHEDGIVTRYAHLSAVADGVHVGRLVATGAIIGAIGNTGHAHGNHLHFEVRIDGKAVDPKPYLALAACPLEPATPIEEARAPDLRPDPRQESRIVAFADEPRVKRAP